ncbi:class II aldolase/adducin family protein [Candidatus Trichorickettsia mobilis]|uniref:class II aldolase/adducin family protein n=1 Tax=Candidatus Trichorickettsia mobilis TaxID=1346319 RepID=UPI00293016B0|nr:class II aldolase/adducin family protein [Candidatus Trichorickettsia mobilis]
MHRVNYCNRYHILSMLQLDDHTYTHLSARPEGADFYYIYPFGLRFEEVTVANLLTVNLDGTVIDGYEEQYNKTGYVIHGSIYQARSDINAIFHIHTPATVAVSAMKEGLLPISQWALHFYNRVSYHNYNSLALDQLQHGVDLIQDLQKNYVMFLRNHGVITSGRTIHEAMFYTYHLEQACKTQCLFHGNYQSLVLPSTAVCQQAVQDLLSFEQNLGFRDWQAWLKVLNKHDLQL